MIILKSLIRLFALSYLASAQREQRLEDGYYCVQFKLDFSLIITVQSSAQLVLRSYNNVVVQWYR